MEVRTLAMAKSPFFNSWVSLEAFDIESSIDASFILSIACNSPIISMRSFEYFSAPFDSYMVSMPITSLAISAFSFSFQLFPSRSGEHGFPTLPSLMRQMCTPP